MARVAVWLVLCVLLGTAFASEVRTLVASLCASNVLATCWLERAHACMCSCCCSHRQTRLNTLEPGYITIIPEYITSTSPLFASAYLQHLLPNRNMAVKSILYCRATVLCKPVD
jgi:hypothetical protein